MIIKFQIYSILHTTPSKGIRESHTNVLLNRNRSFKFYFTVFSGTGERGPFNLPWQRICVTPSPTKSRRFAVEGL